MPVEEVVEKVLEDGAVEKVLERIDALALKLGTTAEHLWEILVKQAYVTFMGYSIRYVLVLIFLGCMIKVFPLFYKSFKSDDFDVETTYGAFSIVAMIVCCIITLICCIAGLSQLTVYISLYVNPEYFAFRKIAEFLD